jgi:hypothetical protein
MSGGGIITKKQAPNDQEPAEHWERFDRLFVPQTDDICNHVFHIVIADD